MKGTIHLDTLYLNVKYPHLDVFRKWYQHVEGVDYRLLKEGIRHGDFVLRNGASLYKFSLWQHDARVFLTDYVDEKAGEGKGSGVWVQLGPKFLIDNIYRLQTAVRELLDAVGIHGEWQTNINRIDIALDLFDIEMSKQDLTSWQNGWVGRSKVSGFFMNSRTGILETIYVGSRKSAVFFRAYDKVVQAENEGDIVYWRDVWKSHAGAVTRLEWEIKPKDGNFEKYLQDFSLFNGFALIQTLNYLLDWGRLCVPNPDDTNNRRWKDAPLWEQARELAKDFSEGVDWAISRYGKEFHGVSDAYIKFLSGTISGGMARFGLDNPNMVALLDGLAKNGQGLETMQKAAEQKAAVFSKL